MAYITVLKCGHNHSEWIKKLDFYIDELRISERRLGEITMKNTDKDMLAQVEHFQNQFIVQENNISDLKHRISRHEHKAAFEAKHHVGKMENGTAAEHEMIDEELGNFEVAINNLRSHFKLFLSKWM